jgi:hypothetical protein
MQQVPARIPAAPVGPLAPLDERLARALAAAGNGARLGEAAELKGGDRRALEARAAELDAWLKPAPESRVVELLASLDRLPARRELDPKEARFAFAQDVSDLRGLPGAALTEAIDALRRGEAGLGHSYRPSAAEIRAVTHRRAWLAQAERAKIGTVLGALEKPRVKLADGARRAELAAQVRARCGVAPPPATKPAPPREDPPPPAPPGMATLGELAERFRAPPVVSTPEMARKLAAMRRETGTA